jgi:hypothetical protein
MGLNESIDTRANPQSIILICESPSRQQALKALLRTAFKEVYISTVNNYQDAGNLLIAKFPSNPLIVIDNWSLIEDPEEGCKLLKRILPGVCCLVLVRQGNYTDQISYSNADVVLGGVLSGSQFIETVQKLVV